MKSFFQKFHESHNHIIFGIIKNDLISLKICLKYCLKKKNNECENGYNGILTMENMTAYLKKIYLASFPLWTNIIANFIPQGKNATSNGIIEEYNYLMKYFELKIIKE